MFQNLPLPGAQEVRDSSGVTTCIVMKNDGVLSIKCSRFLLNPCDYDLFAKVKEPLQETRYNARDELIRAIVQLIRNVNKDGRTHSVRRLSNICSKADK